MLIDKFSATSKLVNSFDELNNFSNVLLTIKQNMDINERKTEILCGLGEALKQGGPSNVSWMEEGFINIKSFLDTRKDLLDQAQTEKRRQKSKPKT